MKNTITLPLIAIGLLSASMNFAQDLNKFETVYYSDPAQVEMPDNSDVKLELKNVVAQKDNAKFGIKVMNDGADVIIFKPSESSFKYAFGEFHPDEKEMIIAPGKSKMKTFNALGSDQFRQEQFSYETGGFYKVPVDGTVIQADDFQLPASRNNMEAGNFKIELKSYKASTAEAKASFEVTYNGDKIALVNSANLSVRAKRNKSEDEVVFANDNKKGDIELMRKGDKIKFDAVFHIEGRIVDMQFATMYIIWNNTFVESEAFPMEAGSIPCSWDPGLTNAKK
ncbi:MAG: hypothetical protein A3D92_06165 [Bacteroidetes bacterium RIFCSPHIGHO2_02_FULL_44_7]|nr:MAG: hypothetical protein A3D92_06165 [Bacteroidetes bacterium RIFCSPHIGHO2_02_FULL_44_7]